MKQNFTLKLLLVIVCLLPTASSWAQFQKSVNVTTPGTLSALISSTDKFLITDLTLSGNLNGSDICFIREMAGGGISESSKTEGKLITLNLAETNIVTGDDYYYGENKTYINCIDMYMFYNLKNLISVVLPNSITYVGEHSFQNCTGLTSIIIPDKVTFIDSDAFDGCTGLTSVTLPKSITSIGEFAFSGCTGLTFFTIPNNITSIDQDAFSGCTGLTSITIPGSVTSIYKNAFCGCTGLKEINVSNENPEYTDIDGVLFNKESGLELVTYPNARSAIYSVPNNVTAINNHAFSGCIGLTSITIPNTVASIGNDAFFGCTGLVSVSIPNSINYIGEYLFSGCTGLSSVTIPESVTNIYLSAFEDCSGLKEIHTKNATPPNAGTDAFTGVDRTACKLYVPKGSKAIYAGTAPWSSFINIVEEESTAISKTEVSNVTVYADQGAIVAHGIDQGETISVYTLLGSLVQTIKATNSRIKIDVPSNQVYVVKIANKIYKVAL